VIRQMKFRQKLAAAPRLQKACVSQHIIETIKHCVRARRLHDQATPRERPSPAPTCRLALSDKGLRQIRAAAFLPDVAVRLRANTISK